MSWRYFGWLVIIAVFVAAIVSGVLPNSAEYEKVTEGVLVLIFAIGAFPLYLGIKAATEGEEGGAPFILFAFAVWSVASIGYVGGRLATGHYVLAPNPPTTSREEYCGSPGYREFVESIENSSKYSDEATRQEVLKNLDEMHILMGCDETLVVE